MDAIVTKLQSSNLNHKPAGDARPSRAEAEAAVRTLLRWTGDNPDREGLIDTPARVVKAYGELFGGYFEEPAAELGRTFEEVAGYDDMVLIKDIAFHSHCEHHMVPIIGKAHVAYLPDGKVVGLSKIARIVDYYARRLQIQEVLTKQIAECVQSAIGGKGVGVVIEAQHMCMMMRGVEKQNSIMTTSCMLGHFRSHPQTRNEFLRLLGN